MSDPVLDEAGARRIRRQHWLFRVVPVSLWSVRCNRSCDVPDPHTHHMSPLYLWMERRADR